RQLLSVTAIPRNPGDRGGIALRGRAQAARLADGRQRIVVDLAAGERRHLVVQEPHEKPRHAGLGLAALAEEDDVLAAQHRVLDLRHHALLVPDDTREERLSALEPGDQVVPHLLLDRPGRVSVLTELRDGESFAHDANVGLRADGVNSARRQRLVDGARPGQYAAHMLTTPRVRFDDLLSTRGRIGRGGPAAPTRPVVNALYEFGGGFPDPASFPY